MATSKRIQVVLNDTLYERLMDVSDKTGMTQSTIIRKALNGYINFCLSKIEAEEKLNTDPDVAGKHWK